MIEDTNKILAAIAELRGEVTELRGEGAGLRAKVDAQPDLRLLGRQIAVLTKETASNGHDIRQVIAAINRIARENVTPGEVEAIHRDLDKVRTYLDHEARIRRIEAELHLPS